MFRKKHPLLFSCIALSKSNQNQNVLQRFLCCSNWISDIERSKIKVKEKSRKCRNCYLAVPRTANVLVIFCLYLYAVDVYCYFVYIILFLPPPRLLCNHVGLSLICSLNLSVCTVTEKSNQPISLKLDVMIGPTDRKNWSTFGRDRVPDTDYGSLSTSLAIAE